MPLQNINIRPGINKTDTPSGAEGQWIDGDFIRFRYGQPEKIGGWQAIGAQTVAGPVRAQHTWTSLDGKKYAALGTAKILAIYYEEKFYDITPLDTAITGATFDTTDGSSTVTVNRDSHGLVTGEYFTFTSVTAPPGSGYEAPAFTTNTFEVLTVPDVNSFTITMPSDATGTTEGVGSASINPYVEIGPTIQTYGFGWGTDTYGGEEENATLTTLDGAITATATSITLTDASSFPSSGKILIYGSTTETKYSEAEIIEYSSKAGNVLTVKADGDDLDAGRGSDSTTARAHSDNVSVADSATLLAWGDESNTSNTILDPGSWSLDNFGQQLIATIKDGKTFIWNPGVANPLTNRATVMTNAPTTSRLTQVSDRDRHLFHFGTETTIGDTATQDPMFIRFSNQEDYNTYIPTATNTAGTFRLDTGNKIVTAVAGKDYTLVLTDQAAYVIQFVGPPFIFSVRQVGTNCGCIGQHAAVYSDGEVYWMGLSGGFFKYDGTVKLLPSLVEDFVFATSGDNLGINYASNEIVYASHNSLFNEIIWFYAKGTPTDNPSLQIDRSVTYNYVENTWSISTLARTTFEDASTYDLPYATEYDRDATPQFPTINGATNTFGASTYFAHEIGVNGIGLDGAPVAINAFVTSGDFDLPIGPAGTGEFLLKVRRFIPDFKNLQGKAKITLGTKDYPIAGNTTTSEFEVTNATTKVDTRVRGRLANIKIENDSVDQNWRYGTFRVDVQPDGRR